MATKEKTTKELAEDVLKISELSKIEFSVPKTETPLSTSGVTSLVTFRFPKQAERVLN